MKVLSRQLLSRSPLAVVAVMRPLHARALLLLLAGLLTLALWQLFGSSLRSFEEQAGVLGWRLAPATVTEERISVVAIDEKSLERLGSWPWPRETMARLATALREAGVQLQMYDIAFPEAKQGDEQFLAALEGAGAILSQVPVLQSEQSIQAGQLSHPVSGLSCAEGLPTASSFVGNAPVFNGIAKGHISPLVDSDGAVRKVPAFICVDGQAYSALALSALFSVTSGQSNWAATLQAGSGLLGPAQVLQLPAYPGLRIPLDAEGFLRVSFKQAPEVFRAFSAVDVIEGNIDPALLDNTWVLVGYTAFGLADIVPTPYNGAAPGVELQARLLASLLDANVPYTPRSAPLLLVLLSLLCGAALLLLAGARERVAGYGLAAAALLLPLGAVLLHAQLLASANLWLGWFVPALYSLCGASLLLLHEHSRVRMERSRVFSNLSSYLPIEVAQEIAYTLPSSSIAAQRRNVTLLSADLRNFSAYGEARPPEESAALLHYFFVRTTDLIEQHGGRVHEFKGDSLLAIWDGSDSAAAAAALQAALAMQQTIGEVLPETPPPGLEPLALGIGIEQGPVLIGSIGPAHRRSHTLLGETVTIALRIQELTAELAQPILLGECAARQLSDQGLESQGSYLLNGLRIPHTLFAPAFQEHSERSPHKARSKTALRVLLGGRH